MLSVIFFSCSAELATKANDKSSSLRVLDLETEMAGCRFSIGLRNSHDKSMHLAPTCGYRVFVCSNTAFAGDFTPVLAKHSKSFSLIDCIAVGVDRMQRNFEPMRKQVEAWQKCGLADVTAKVVIYDAFVEGKLEAPKHLARAVHDLYFVPKYEEFRPRTIWSLSNAFTSAFKELDPIPQFRATAKLGEFLEARFFLWLSKTPSELKTRKSRLHADTLCWRN